MSFNKKEISAVSWAFKLADQELHNQIATCPDVVEFANEIFTLNRQRAEMKALGRKVVKHLQQESRPAVITCISRQEWR